MNQHMIRPRHTPGPWYTDGPGLGIYYDKGISRIATIEGSNLDQRIANARLIAKAPELFATLRNLVGCLANEANDDAEWETAQALIKELKDII